MHAWLCENPTGVDALHWQEMPTGEPAAEQVLIEINARRAFSTQYIT